MNMAVRYDRVAQLASISFSFSCLPPYQKNEVLYYFYIPSIPPFSNVHLPIDGNSDFYGIGIRIGFYLQWYSGILASHIAKKEVPSLRLTLGLFIAANILALIAEVIQNPSDLQVAEIYIILLITSGYYTIYIPVFLWRLLTCFNSRLDPTRYPLVRAGLLYIVLTLLLVSVVASFQMYYWIAVVPRLDALSCEEYGFFFAKVRLNDKAFQVFNILIYFLLLLTVLILLIYILVVEQVKTCSQARRKKLRQKLRWFIKRRKLLLSANYSWTGAMTD